MAPGCPYYYLSQTNLLSVKCDFPKTVTEILTEHSQSVNGNYLCRKKRKFC